jgi:hypothetical protein
MPDDPLSRRLTTIVALDVAGYSARTEARVDETLRLEVVTHAQAASRRRRAMATGARRRWREP